ncbi:MAG TPA: MMPL family transporter [Polyangiaceae bacterium]|nr:MMPL family transporter [Polyangiaceae bacterium]
MVVAAVTAVFGAYATRLSLDTRYEALLPDNQPSVKELHRVEGRTAIAQTVLILLENDPRSPHVPSAGTALRSMGDAIVPALLALGPQTISSAEDGPHETRAFLSARAGLFMDLPALEKLKRDVDDRWEYEVAKKVGSLLDDDPPPPLTAESLQRRFRDNAGGQAGATDAYPNGYYERGDGGALVIIARSPLAGGDLAHIGPAFARIRAVVAKVQADSPAYAGVRVSYAGDMPTGLFEYGVILSDLLSVGAVGIALVLGAVLLYFLRVRALIAMATALLAGLVWTFGVTAVTIGHLNIATAFLISVVAGNAVNVGILYQSRYFEERRAGKTPQESVRTAIVTTWKPTVIAAGASAASYGSLLVTDFRAFRDFGFIAASGMLLCWIVQTCSVLPILVLLDRRPVEKPGWLQRFEMAYGRPFAWLVARAPTVWLVSGAAVAVLGCALAVRYAGSDPMEYDLRRVQNDAQSSSGLQRAWSICNEILGTTQGGMVVLADTPEQARELEDALRARWDAAPKDRKPFASVRSLWSFVAHDQSAKLPVLRSLGEKLRDAHERGFVTDEDWERMRDVMPPKDVAPFGLDDLPAEIARPFTERNGTRGTLVFVQSQAGSSDDLHYLLRYADSFRETHLPSGQVVRGSGHAVIFADMLKATARDIPKAISLSLALTLVAVLLAFRRGRQAWPVLFALFVGSGGVGAFLYFGHVKLNFLNFAALPITFGIGVDYAVNVAQRYYTSEKSDVVATLRTSGGAVVLCSLTTMLGYLALLGSHNQAIRSLGAIAVVGEISCLLAAMLALGGLFSKSRKTGRSGVASERPRIDREAASAAA